MGNNSFWIVMLRRLLVIPWDPRTLFRKPWKGKWSGPRPGAEWIWTMPVPMASPRAMAASMSRVKTQPCRAYRFLLERSNPLLGGVDADDGDHSAVITEPALPHAPPACSWAARSAATQRAWRLGFLVYSSKGRGRALLTWFAVSAM